MANKHFRVLVADSIDSSGVEILRSVASVDVKPKLTEDQLCEIIENYDAMVVRSGTRVTARIIQCGRKLKIVGRAGVGVDNVDVDAATNRGIYVVNSPQGNTVAAAEHTIALMFALSRNIPSADASVRSGQWEREKFMGNQLQHKLAGIIGLGQVGSHVAKICREIGMDLMCYDPYVNVDKAEALGCRVVELEELLREADVITLHVPLVAETKNLIDAQKIKMMKPTALFVNCSRGGVVNEQALCEALKERRIAGAALDVFEKEGKMEPNSILLSTPNLVLTPHLGASTREAQINVAVDVAQQIRATLHGNVPESAVNIPGFRSSELAHLRPLIECCEMLGKLAMQLLHGPLEQIIVTVEGEFAAVERTEPLLLGAANGAIGIHTAAPVNFVNVNKIASEHRIKMVFVKNPNASKNAIVVDVRSGMRSAQVRGTITEDKAVLLKSFDGIPVYMTLPTLISRSAHHGADSAAQSPTSGFENNDQTTTGGSADELMVSSQKNRIANKEVTLLYTRHDDTPGVLASITAILRDAGVNIANCHLGRRRFHEKDSSNKGIALAIFHIDDDCPEAVLENLRQIQVIRASNVLKV